MLTESVVEVEILVVNVLRYAVYFILALVYDNIGVSAGHTVYLTVFKFLLKKRPFLNTNADAQLVGCDVVLSWLDKVSLG